MTLTDLARAVLGGVRLIGPILVGVAVTVLVLDILSTPGRTRLRLAHAGLSRRARSRLRRLLGGTLVPALGIAALTVSLSLEHEVREGPNRMIDQLQAGAGNWQPTWILQRGTSHFMDDSRLPDAVLTAARADSSGAAHAVWEQLATVQKVSGTADTGLILAVPAADRTSPLRPAVDPETARCTVVQSTCVLQPGQAVTDSSVAPVGSRLQVRGQFLTVIANTRMPFSLINRAVVFTDVSLFTRTNGTMDPAYAVVVGGPGSLRHGAELARASGRSDAVEVLTGAQVKANNATFWAGNGTPLLLLVISLSALFCGVALYAARRAFHHRERTSTGTLQALGVSLPQICRIDTMRATLVCLIAAIAATPLAYAILRGVDAGMLGFHATLTAVYVLSAAGLLILANGLGTGVMYLQLRRVPLVETMGET